MDKTISDAIGDWANIVTAQIQELRCRIADLEIRLDKLEKENGQKDSTVDN